MKELEGKVALVTGGGSGIGRATAVLLARRGARVVVSDYNWEAARQTCGIIDAEGGEALPVQTDVRIAREVEEMVKETVDKFGRLDCAFNNAGASHPWARLARISEEDFDRTMDTNVKGVFLSMKYEIPIMQRQGGGVIINCASSAANRASDRLSVYSASKFAVLGLTNAAAIEYGKDNIRIVAISPGWIETPPVQELMNKEKTGEILQKMIPLGRLGKPEEVAELVCWLASDRASYISGGNIMITAGMNL
ncbi:MAG: glucose 1-dehydrogenase [Syntrophales bacterium]|nr:glucose 1-dehydrogenase [Syntrophales bacterium]